MTVTIVGSQLGDEGKGALVDRWGGDADVVVRYQGGASSKTARSTNSRWFRAARFAERSAS